MKIHPLKNLSYSGLLTLDACPRKFYLDKSNPMEQEQITFDQSVTFAFGSVVGIGIQEYMREDNLSAAIFAMFLAWEPDLFADDPKRKKSFWEAVFAVEKFAAIRSDLFADYELATFNGKPAIELSFRIALPDGSMYRGFVDLVLRHRYTGKVVVLELKTTSAKVTDAAMYKNSFQGIGYSVVLDRIAPDLSQYIVYYLVYNTNNYEYLPLPFPKSLAERAEWLTTLWLRTQEIAGYMTAGCWPKRGQSCYNFFRECYHYSSCNIPLLNPTTEIDDETAYDVEVTFAELIAAQQEKL